MATQAKLTSPSWNKGIKVNEVGCEESRHFSSFGFIMAALVKFSLCFGPGKASHSRRTEEINNKFWERIQYTTL